MRFSAGYIQCYSTCILKCFDLYRIICCKIRRYHLPAYSFICAFMNELAAEINCFFIKWILRHCCVPVPAQHLFWIQCWWFYKPTFSCFPISTTYISSLAFTKHPACIFSIWHHIKTITAADIVPVIIFYTCIDPCISRAMPASIILHATHYIIRHFVVNIDMIKLPNRKFIIKYPVLTTVMCDTNTTIISFDHKISVFRMYPPCMVIGMYA